MVAQVESASDVKLAKLAYQLEACRAELSGSRARVEGLERQLAKVCEKEPNLRVVDALYATRFEMDHIETQTQSIKHMRKLIFLLMLN